jgi:hypothetical protein
MFVAGNLCSLAGGAARFPSVRAVEGYQAAPSERDNDRRRKIFSGACKKAGLRKARMRDAGRFG